MQRVKDIYDTSRRPPALIEELLALVEYRELIFQFISRSIKTRYKRSFLGVVWTMLNPLLTMAILTLVFSNLFRFSVEAYPVYILCGLTAWNFFSSSTNGAMGEMVWSGDLLSRIYVPKTVFAVSAIGTSLVNLTIALIPLFVITLLLGVKITPAVLVLPFSILLLAMFALGVGLLLSAAAVYFADMIPVYEVGLMLWMYATPIIYPIEIIPENLQWIFKLNPMYYLVTLFREPIYNGTIPDLHFWLIGGGCSLVTLAVGSLVFTSRSQDYAYRI
jgi:ABC-type polysaccharide/polyol phosphate export permease